MRGTTGGKRILASGTVMVVPGEDAVIEGVDGFTLTLAWSGDDGLNPGGSRKALRLELPAEQSDDRIFMGFGMEDDYGATLVRFAVDYLEETLRIVTFTAYEAESLD